jgi:hypothetical protein
MSRKRIIYYQNRTPLKIRSKRNNQLKNKIQKQPYQMKSKRMNYQKIKLLKKFNRSLSNQMIQLKEKRKKLKKID